MRRSLRSEFKIGGKTKIFECVLKKCDDELALEGERYLKL